MTENASYEQAFKNGYEKGYADAKAEYSSATRCHCHAADENGTPIFVRDDDFCSYVKKRDGEPHVGE